jgi:hypothetical protein
MRIGSGFRPIVLTLENGLLSGGFAPPVSLWTACDQVDKETAIQLRQASTHSTEASKPLCNRRLVFRDANSFS